MEHVAAIYSSGKIGIAIAAKKDGVAQIQKDLVVPPAGLNRALASISEKCLFVVSDDWLKEPIYLNHPGSRVIFRFSPPEKLSSEASQLIDSGKAAESRWSAWRAFLNALSIGENVYSARWCAVCMALIEAQSLAEHKPGGTFGSVLLPRIRRSYAQSRQKFQRPGSFGRPLQ
ncbi:MAG: hypothetical protein F6J97_08165 [Leptolyngbya sp. SIO4C1]|nr:hypothetical protein [Leptolyngbya sp. SIO4C1]